MTLEEKKLLTREEARQRFTDRGETITAWAASHGYPRSLVYALLNGVVKGHHGRAHELAVALGLKHGVEHNGSKRTL